MSHAYLAEDGSIRDYTAEREQEMNCGTFKPIESFSQDTQDKLNAAIKEAQERPIEQEQDWFFTFCGVHYSGLIRLDRRFVKIKGTYNSARVQMTRARNDAWGFQYNAEQFKNQVEDYRLTEISLNEVKVREL